MTTLASMGTMNALDQLIDEHHLLKHPFYRAWTAGKLSRKQLALYAEQYYQHVRAFPKHLERLAARSDGELHTLVAENLAEELDPHGPHPILWRQFAAAVGARQEALESTAALPGVAALVDTLRESAEHGPLAEAVAAFYSYEAQVPEIATEKIAGLRRFYGIEDSKSLLYFSVHEEADVRHRAAWRRWLAEQPEADAETVLRGAERALRALWGALDAVYPEGCGRN